MERERGLKGEGREGGIFEGEAKNAGRGRNIRVSKSKDLRT